MPNSASWFLWAYLSILNVSMYFKETLGDWQKCAVPSVNAMAMSFTFLFALTFGHLTFPTTEEWYIIFIAFVASLIWYRYSERFGQVILQLAFTIAFIPICVAIWNIPHVEEAYPWYIWEISYILGIFVVLLRWNKNPMELFYPILVFLRVAFVIILIEISPIY